jgi:hypothetical protein
LRAIVKVLHNALPPTAGLYVLCVGTSSVLRNYLPPETLSWKVVAHLIYSPIAWKRFEDFEGDQLASLAELRGCSMT